MITAIVVTVALFAALAIAQSVWLIHNHRVFCRFKRQWEAAEAEWNAARMRGDSPAMKLAYKREEIAIAAERAVHRDQWLPPWKWIGRWSHDYLAEGER